MALRPLNFLFSFATLTTALTAVIACSSDESGSDDTGTPTGPSTTTSTATHTSSSTSSSTTSSAVSTTTSTSAAVTTTSAGPSTTTSTTGTGTTSTTGAGGTSTTGAGGTSTTTDGTNSGAGGTSSTTGGGTGEFTLTSPGFTDDGICSNEAPDTCDLLPRENSNYYDNESPELNWTAGPEGTLGYVLVMHDLTNGFGHWAVWTLSAETQSLPAALPSGTLTTPVEAEQKSLQGAGYFGPRSCMNVYEFKMYALNVETFTPAITTSVDTIQDELEASDIVLDTATLRVRANPEDCT